MDNPQKPVPESTKPNVDNEDKGGGKIALIIIVIIMLLATNIFLLWQFFSKKTEIITLTETTVHLKSERDSIKTDLDKTVIELNTIKDDNAQLKGKLTATETALEEKKAQIEKMIRSGELVQAKKTLVSLKLEIENYKMQIDSLKQVNLALKSENVNLNQNLTQEKSKNENLSQENTSLSVKVVAGSKLKAAVSKVSAIKVKSNGKEVEVTKASVVEKIKICFTVFENKVAEKGSKTIYLRILAPSNNVMTSNLSETIQVSDQPVKTSYKQDFKYENKDQDMCLYFTSQNTSHSQNNNTMIKGDYTVELYCEGAIMGRSKFNLK